MEKGEREWTFAHQPIYSMPNILVTGANGQLGSELRDLAHTLPEFSFVFTDVAELDLTNQTAVQQAFADQSFAFCLHAAAYTAVDKAESDAATAHLVNVTAVEYLAKACQVSQTVLILISTDFVFDGQKNTPYLESDEARPLGVYGQTKLAGENVALNLHPATLVIRTAWLYSHHGNNFVKTMLRLGHERGHLRVIADQTGTPTYARDLAVAILAMTKQLYQKYYHNWQGINEISGVYHYSNEGLASWYDFAHAIFALAQLPVTVEPIPTSAYPTAAQRPAYSVMDKQKIKAAFGLKIPHWRDSLRECMAQLAKDQA